MIFITWHNGHAWYLGCLSWTLFSKSYFMAVINETLLGIYGKPSRWIYLETYYILYVWVVLKMSIKSGLFAFTLAANDWFHCIAVIDCGRPFVPAHGSIDEVTDFTYPNIVTFTCQQGYVLQGHSIIRCESNGRWSDTSPRCFPKGEEDEEPHFGSFCFTHILHAHIFFGKYSVLDWLYPLHCLRDVYMTYHVRLLGYFTLICLYFPSN